MTAVQWGLLLNKNPNPNARVKLLNQTILNIISNFVPSSTFSFNMNEPEWIARAIKNQLRKQKTLCKKYRLNGFREEDKVDVDRLRDECFQSIKTSKENYLIP